MKLLIIRHAEAEDLHESPTGPKRDADRHLTDAGRKDMRRAAKGLQEIVPAIDILAASPLVRAQETAEIIAKVFGISKIIKLDPLVPDGDKHALITWLEQQPADVFVAIVGHEPYLSTLASLLISGETKSALTFKKGACCLIEFRDHPGFGNGTLQWLLQPDQLRQLKDSK